MAFPFRMLCLLPPAAVLLSLVACSSDPEAPAPEPIVGISYTVDGAPVKTSAVGNGFVGPEGTGHRVLNGRLAGNGSGVEIHLPLPLAVGTYPLTVGTAQAASGQAGATYWASPGGYFTPVSGSVVVTALDQTSAAGTFALTVRCASQACPAGSTRVLANGTFRVRR